MTSFSGLRSGKGLPPRVRDNDPSHELGLAGVLDDAEDFIESAGCLTGSGTAANVLAGELMSNDVLDFGGDSWRRGGGRDSVGVLRSVRCSPSSIALSVIARRTMSRTIVNAIESRNCMCLQYVLRFNTVVSDAECLADPASSPNISTVSVSLPVESALSLFRTDSPSLIILVASSSPATVSIAERSGEAWSGCANTLDILVAGCAARCGLRHFGCRWACVVE